MPENEKKAPVVRRCTAAFAAWCAEDTPSAKFERTVAQGVVGAVAAGTATGEWGAAFATALVMAVIAPVQAMLGRKGDLPGDGDPRGND